MMFLIEKELCKSVSSWLYDNYVCHIWVHCKIWSCGIAFISLYFSWKLELLLVPIVFEYKFFTKKKANITVAHDGQSVHVSGTKNSMYGQRGF